jgi:DNA polymerase-3 subunit alpha
MSVSQRAHYAEEIGQLGLFDLGEQPVLALELQEAPEIPRRRQLAWEKELLGLYVSEHPLQQMAPGLDKYTNAVCGQIDKTLDRQTVIVAGMIATVRRVTTKNDRLMAFAELEDLHGSAEVVVFPDPYEKTRELWKPDNILMVRGRVQFREEEAKIICESAVDYHEWVQESGEEEEEATAPRIRHQLHISVPRTGNKDEDVRLLSEVHALLTSQPGEDLFDLYVRRDDRLVQLIFPNETTAYSPSLEKAVADLLGQGCLRVERIDLT